MGKKSGPVGDHTPASAGEHRLRGTFAADTRLIIFWSGHCCLVQYIDGAYIEFPYDIKKEFGKGRVKVHAEFDDIPYDGSIVNMGLKNDNGSICYIIGITKSIRQKANKHTLLPGRFGQF